LKNNQCPKHRVALITNFPSYYQVDIFNQINSYIKKYPNVSFKVFYLRKLTPGRQWKVLPALKHDYCFVKEWRIHKHFYLNPNFFDVIRQYSPTYCIVTQYASIAMQLLMYYCNWKKIPWIFWSESAGMEYTELPIIKNEKLRHLLRHIALTPIRKGPKQIWGIGERAVKQYSQLTQVTCIKNVPYFFNQIILQRIKRNYKNKHVKFLFAGKFVYRKGLDILLKAIEILIEGGKEFEVIIVGDGPDKDLINLEKDYMTKYLKYKGFKEISEMPEVFAACDVLVCPSRYDGWGMVVAEAMAAGMPIISTMQTGSAIDILQNGVNGILLSEPKVDLLVEAMGEFIKNPEIIVNMGINARKTASRYSCKIGAKLILHNLNIISR